MLDVLLLVAIVGMFLWFSDRADQRDNEDLEGDHARRTRENGDG